MMKRRRFVGRGALLAVAGVSIYLLAPGLVEVFASWDRLRDLEVRWLVMVGVLQVASLASLWALQRKALRVRAWLPVITSQLAANAASRVVPGGAAAATAVQYRLLGSAGIKPTTATSGLAAAGLLQLGVTFALPAVAVPAIVLGAPIPRDLLNAVWLGSVLFVCLFIIVAAALWYDRPLAVVGRIVDATRRRISGPGAVARPAGTVLLAERDSLVAGLEGRWIRAVAMTVGRAAFDYASLMTALAAFGSDALPSLVLLAYASAVLLGLVPLTPGGLGFVEAGLTGMLTLAGVPASAAVAATLLYRLFSFWLPIPIGILAGVSHRLIYGDPIAA